MASMIKAAYGAHTDAQGMFAATVGWRRELYASVQLYATLDDVVAVVTLGFSTRNHTDLMMYFQFARAPL